MGVNAAALSVVLALALAFAGFIARDVFSLINRVACVAIPPPLVFSALPLFADVRLLAAHGRQRGQRVNVDIPKLLIGCRVTELEAVSCSAAREVEDLDVVADVRPADPLVSDLAHKAVCARGSWRTRRGRNIESQRPNSNRRAAQPVVEAKRVGAAVRIRTITADQRAAGQIIQHPVGQRSFDVSFANRGHRLVRSDERPSCVAGRAPIDLVLEQLTNMQARERDLVGFARCQRLCGSKDRKTTCDDFNLSAHQAARRIDDLHDASRPVAVIGIQAHKGHNAERRNLIRLREHTDGHRVGLTTARPTVR